MTKCYFCQDFIIYDEARCVYVTTKRHPDGDKVRICDACRRVLCTCGRCSAFHIGVADEDGERWTACWRSEQAAGKTRPFTRPEAWCRDGWRQARVWEEDDARRLLADACKGEE